jgi:hypothetical protein
MKLLPERSLDSIHIPQEDDPSYLFCIGNGLKSIFGRQVRWSTVGICTALFPIKPEFFAAKQAGALYYVFRRARR